MTTQYANDGHGLEAGEFISFMTDVGGAELLASTLDLNLSEVCIAVWELDRFAVNMPPADFHLLGLGLSGRHKGHHSFENRRGPEEISISPGAIFYVPVEETTLFSGSGRVVIMHVMLAHSLVEQITEKQQNKSQEPHIFKGFNRLIAPRLTIPMLSVFREVILAQSGFETMIRNLAQMIAGELIKTLHALAQPEIKLSPRGLTNTLFASIVDHIEANVHKPLDLDNLAKETGLGASLIETGFEETANISLRNYFESARLNRAFYEIACTIRPINEIAQSVGFDDTRSFKRAFHLEFNQSVDSIRS